MLNASFPGCDLAKRIVVVNDGTGTCGRARKRRSAWWAALLLVVPLAAQAPRVAFSGANGEPSANDAPGDTLEARMAAKRISQLNQNRQKAMVSSAQKLLHLAQELRDDAAAGGANLSQAERMHKAEEIQKLAKDVKEKMTYAIGQPEHETPSPYDFYPR